MKDIRFFVTEEQYENYKESDNVIYPYVCYAKDTDKVFANKEGIELITFYINRYDAELLEYQAEKGMTWYEWCNSPYNNTSDEWYVTESEYDIVIGNGEDWGYGGQYDAVINSCGTCIIESNKTYELLKDGWGVGNGGSGE